MSQESLVAADLGAGSGRVLRAVLDGGHMSVAEVHRFDNPQRNIGGFLRWDAEFLEAQIREGLSRARRLGPVASVGVDTWAVDFVLTDDDGQPLEPPRAYRNEHTRAFVEPILEQLGAAALYGRTGIQTQHFNSIYQLAAWKAGAPQGFARARRFAMMPDWLLHRLGAPLVNEITNASSTQLLDARSRDWDTESLGALDLPTGLFTKPVAPGTILRPQTGDEPALVAVATHDTASAVAGTPLRGPRAAYISTGTWCLIGIESAEPETEDASRADNFTNEAGVDGTYRYLKNCMGLWLINGLQASWPDAPPMAQLWEAAARAEPFRALVDPDAAEFFQPSSMAKALQDWLTATGQHRAPSAGDLARTCLESLALTFAAVLDRIQELRGLRLEVVHLVGGGIRNPLLCQLTADATGLPVAAGPVEASALGNLVVQARALGWVADQAEARRAYFIVIPRRHVPAAGQPRPVAGRAGTPAKTEANSREQEGAFIMKSPSEAVLKAAYQAAKDRYADWGVDPDKALATLRGISLSLPCWQGDDVAGFEKKASALSGGILVTGGAPGRARNGDQLRADLEFSLSLIPGNHRVNLHAMYLEADTAVDRDAVEPRHFDRWVDWAKTNKLALDFNPTYFSHPKAEGLTLSHPDAGIRDFWVQHGLACRTITADFGRRLGTPSVVNTWVPDGYKDAPVDRWEARRRLAESLDRIHAAPADPRLEIDAVESKLFGIGVESATVGSHEFYLGWAVKNAKTLCLDMGHFHPTEDVGDKLSAVLRFVPSVLLHLSRPVRWDSDHVVIQDDPTARVAEELVRIGAWDRVHLGLDYFDATLNRPAAWVIGSRAVLRALLAALLQPTALLQGLERSGDVTAKLMHLEELKAAPWQAVWDWHCHTSGVPVGAAWYDEITAYANKIGGRNV